MTERIIEHPLRTIKLLYNEQVAETPADVALVKRYIELHDAFLALRKQYAKLRYEYLELTDEMVAVLAALEEIELGIDALVQEGDVLLTKVKRGDVIADLMNRMQDYTDVIQAFHADTLMPFVDAITVLSTPWDAFLEAEDAFDEFFSTYVTEVESPFYANAAEHSLDFNRYFDDMEELKDECDKQPNINDAQDVIDGHDNIVDRVNTAYAKWKKTQEEITLFFADDSMLDCAISTACAKNELPKADRPLYLIDPNDKRVSSFVANYGLMADKANKFLVLNVPLDVVQEGQVMMIQEIVMVMQHYPKMLEKMLYSLSLQFTTEYGSVLEDNDWKGVEQYVRWIHGFYTLPAVYFFLADHDARSYFLMGDLVFDGKVKIDSDNLVKVEGEALDTLANRVFIIGYFFMLYCHNTGFDPTPHIQRLLDEMRLPITIESIRKEFEDSIAKGIELQARPFKK
jgi:hypothetical protein